MGERLYQKRGYWYGWYYDASNKRRPTALRTKDKRTAQLRLRRIEREAHGENHTAANTAPHSVLNAMTDWLANGLTGKAPGTVDYYGIKSGHLNRILGKVDVNGLSPDKITKYVETRAEEGASQHTISKEMTTLRLCLKWAKKEGKLVRDPRALVPEMRSGYVPRERALTRDEFERLLASFKRKHRRDWLMVAVYTGGRQSELESLSWREHVDMAGGWITLPGTKTEKARRRVPIAAPLRAVLSAMKRRADGLVVGPWEGAVEDLRKKCLDIGIEKVSPNDLRRTFASWLVQKGTPLKVVAELLGHTSTVMVEKVYGHLVNDNLRDAVKTLPRIRMRVAHG